MAKIKKIKEGTATVYPATIPQAVIDPTSGKSVRTELNEKTVTSELNKVYPLYNYNVRVGADSGSIGNLEELTKLYNENLTLLDSTVFLWSGVAGIKTRTSGSNQFASKLYNMANKVQQFGAELVTNGTFTGADGSTPAGWTGLNATLTVDTNRLKITNNNAGSAGSAYQTISTTAGKTYHIAVSHQDGNVSLSAIKVESVLGSNDIINQSVSSATLASKLYSFIAKTSTTIIRLTVNTTVLNDYNFWDSISVKQMDWIEGTNDAIQTTEANQPYVGGVITPNEVRKLKPMLVDPTTPFATPIQFASNEGWTLTFMFNSSRVKAGQAHNGGIFRNAINTINMYVDSAESGRVFLADSSLTSPALFETANETVKAGRNNILQLAYTANSITGYLNGSIITNTAAFQQFALGVTGFFHQTASRNNTDILHAQIHNRALSASEIQAQHDFLRLQIPEIEGVAIGNQYWQTSNYEGVVAGDGSVIQEVQNSDNVEKITNAADREFSSDTGFWSKSGATVTIADGVGKFTSSPSISFFRRSNIATIGKWYRIRITQKDYVAGTLLVGFNSRYTPGMTANGSYDYYVQSDGVDLFIVCTGVSNTFNVDDFSFEEVGWSQSTAVYDAIYAQTSGTAAQKELAALKAAAMWCYYNNDVNNGAIYGKELNGYAIKLLALYPPTGYRVAFNADYSQLVTYLGGSSVAGAKLKALFGGFNNSNSTNESGFSAIAGGRRKSDGTFSAINLSVYIGTGDLFRLFLDASSKATEISTYATDMGRGYYVRLLRNSPVGPNEKTITSTTITSDIASTANSTQIPFGYSVASIRLKTTANLTNIKVELWNNFYSGTPTLVSTLITGKTANNTTMVFPVLADAAALLQDGTLRITATGAATFETIVEYNLQKNTF